MQQVFNYFYCRQDPLQGLESPEIVKNFCEANRLQGVELLLPKALQSLEEWQEVTVGVHLPYWPCWIPFYDEDAATLKRCYPTEKQLVEYYGARNKKEFLANLRGYLAMASKLKPRYVVWHVADCLLEEAFTFRFRRSNKEVLRKTAELYKEVADALAPDIEVLFENLWWPGLTLREPEELAYFMDLLQGYKVGVMLDTGHLVNTSLKVQDEQEAIEFLLQQIKALGPLKKYIRGLHLNLSLSAGYRAKCPKVFPKQVTHKDIFKHIGSIDQHLYFTDGRIAELLDLIQPEYVNHELSYRNLGELKRNLHLQQLACARRIPANSNEIKQLIKRLQSSKAAEVTVNKSDYIDLLHELSSLRFKAKYHGSQQQNFIK